MKKRLLSLVLCLVMVFSLFPAFAAPAMAAGIDEPGKLDNWEFVEVQAPGGRWTLTGIRDYQNPDEMAVNNDLYYLRDGKYYKVNVVSDPYYFKDANSNGSQIKIYGNFSLEKPDSNYRHLWNRTGGYGDSSSRVLYWLDESTWTIHQVYYNSYNMSQGWDVEIYVYTDTTQQYYTSGDSVNSETSRNTALNNHTIMQLLNNGQTGYSTTDYGYGAYNWRSRDYTPTGASANKWRYITGHQFYEYSGTSYNRYAAYIELDDGRRDYIARDLKSTTANDFGSVSLYYMRNRTPDEAAGETWIYEPVNNQAWLTDTDYDSYGDLFYYDGANFHRVYRESADLFASAGTSWTLSNAPGKYYMDAPTEFGVVQKGQTDGGEIYTKVTSNPSFRNMNKSGNSQNKDAISIGQDVYGVRTAYFYKVSDSTFKRVFTTNYAKTDQWKYIGHTYYYNGPAESEPTGMFVDKVSEGRTSEAWNNVKSNFVEIEHFDWNWLTDSDHAPSGTYYTLSSDNDNCLTYETDSGSYVRIPGSSLQVESGANTILYTGDLYSKNGNTGAEYLYYIEDGQRVDISTTAHNGKHSYLAGDTIYTGTLYTRHIDVMGELDGVKTLSDRQSNGSYNLTIDSWATGPYQGYEESEVTPAQPAVKTPLDIVLVVDQSGSMRTADLAGNTTIVPHVEKDGSTSWTLNELRSGTQYYYEKDGKYYPVQLGRGTLYTGPVRVRGNETFGWGNDGISLLVNGAPTYYNVRTWYYVYADMDGDGIKEMHRIRAITAGLDLHYGFYPYIYKDENNNYAQMGKWTDNHYWFRLISPWGANKLRNNDRWNTIVAGGNNDNAALVSFIDKNGNPIGATDSACNSAKMNYSWITDTSYMNNLYYASSRGYANLYYVDDNGNQQIIGTRFMSSEDFTTKGPLYTLSGGTRRVEALESAVNEFVSAVKADATEAGHQVDHKIAIVGYAQNHSAAISPAASDAKVLGSNGLTAYTNTGLFTGNDFGTFTNYDHVSGYSNAFVSASQISSDFTNTFGTWGGTYPSYGMDMAQQILQNGRSDAKKVVIVFTDGEPGEDGYQDSAAAEALVNAAAVKDKDVEVYTVGLYPQSVSSEGAAFLKQLSSEYTTTKNEVQASNMDPNETYLVESNGQYTAVTTDYYGESSLGWWEDLGNGQYRMMNVKGGNAGAGEEYLYDGSSQVTGEDANTNKTYTSAEGNPARYEYHWFDAEMNIVVPTGTVYTLSNERQPGEYSQTTSTKAGLEQIFRNLAKEIQVVEQSQPAVSTGGGAVNYDSSNSVIRDVISSDFSKESVTVKLELVPATLVNGKVVEKSGVAATDVTNDPAYAYSWDGKTITVTGFDFGANSVYSGHDGNIMRVTITGLQPTNTGKVYSNVESQSGIYKTEEGAISDKLFTYENPFTTVATYTVDWNVDGTVVESDKNLTFGTFPSYDGETPVKAEDAQHTYTFVGWSADADAETGVAADQLPAVPENTVNDVVTYYAIFRAADKVYYDVYWMNGTQEMEHDESVLAGTYPTYEGATPVSNEANTYFIGWSTDPSFTVTEDTTPAQLEANLYYGNKTVDQLNPDADRVVKLYAVFLTKVIDNKPVAVVEYSMKHKLDTGVYSYDPEAEYCGTFDLMFDGKDTAENSIGTLYFTPATGMKNGVADLTPLSNVSAAIYYTDAPVDDSRTVIHRVTVVPGSSIYFDDSLAQINDDNTFAAAEQKNGSYDYKTALAGLNGTADDAEAIAKGDTRTFTFTGTRIDVYCTTDSTANSVLGLMKMYDEQGNLVAATDKDGNAVNGKQIANKLTNGGTMYSTPTLSFDNLDNSKTYVLTIRATTANYRLDGIRIYNPTDNSLNGESGVKYTQVRSLLTAFDASATDGTESATGAVFVDKDGFSAQTTEFSTYKDYGPKNEVYLAPGQAIAFQVHDYETVMIGLKSQTGKGVAYVTHSDKNAQSIELTSVVERYVEVVPTSTGIIVVKNSTDASQAPNELIAVTNVRVMPGTKAPAPASVVPTPDEPGAITEPTFSMNTNSVKSYLRSFNTLAVVEPEVIEDPEPSPSAEPDPSPSADPDPTPSVEPNTDPTHTPSISDILSQLFSAFVSRLFGGIARLFGN